MNCYFSSSSNFVHPLPTSQLISKENNNNNNTKPENSAQAAMLRIYNHDVSFSTLAGAPTIPKDFWVNILSLSTRKRDSALKLAKTASFYFTTHDHPLASFYPK
jgi:hypothetical protein